MALRNETAALRKTSGPTSSGNGNSPPPGWWYIYFYGTEDGAEVRLGKTKQSPYARRLQHEHDGGRDQPMRTLAVVLGQNADELALKRYFAPYRSRTRSKEWIEAGEHMRSYLRWLRSQPFVAPGELEMSSLAPIDSSAWLPTGERGKAPLQLRLADEDPWGDLALDHVMEGDFYTHWKLIEASRQAMGSIDLDPASCRDANIVVQASHYFGFRENGLLQDWAGNLWINPPFSQWSDWVPKIIGEWGSGRVMQMCVLCTSRVTTAQTFHPLVQASSALIVMCGRYPFWGPKATSTPDEGHTIFLTPYPFLPSKLLCVLLKVIFEIRHMYLTIPIPIRTNYLISLSVHPRHTVRLDHNSSTGFYGANPIHGWQHATHPPASSVLDAHCSSDAQLSGSLGSSHHPWPQP